MKLRIYLDTSVFSAFFDDRAPDRMSQTREFWERITQFEASTSELAREELAQTLDPSRRAKLLALLIQVQMLPLEKEVESLARRYVDGGAFSPAMINDAMHVASAVLSRQDVLLSWNFRHLVNRRRRAKVNEVNASAGLPTVEILAPPEL
jgi:predicted nucleic acid-binding protein